MENIFKNAYFGKPYRTRSGEKALYSHYDDNYNLHELFTYSQFVWVDNEGFVDEEHLELNDPNDIVSEWQEEINEVELDKLAIEEKKKYKEQLPFYYEFPHSESDLNIRCMGYIDGFKDCYRKVIEKYRSTQNAKN